MAKSIAAVLILLVVLAGCSRPSVTDDEENLARSVVTLLQTRDFSTLESRFDSSLFTGGDRSILVAMAAVLPPEAPTKIERISWKVRETNVLNGQDSRQVDLVYRYEFGDKIVLVTAIVGNRGEGLIILGAHLLPIDEALEEANRFTFEGKGMLHYLVFALAIANPIFILATIVACVRTRIPKRKWLWLIFIVFGIGRMSLNWANGDVYFNPLYAVLLGAGFWQVLYGPWLLHVGVPLGAIVFWIKRPKWRRLALSSAVVSGDGTAKADGTETVELREDTGSGVKK